MTSHILYSTFGPFTVSERKCTMFEIASSLEIMYSVNPSLGVKDIHRHSIYNIERSGLFLMIMYPVMRVF